MFSRCTAWLFVVLITLPFTAPFSTCDLSVLVSASPPAAALPMSISKDGRAVSIEESAAAQASGWLLEEERFKDAQLTAPATVGADFAFRSAPAGAKARTLIVRNPLIALRL